MAGPNVGQATRSLAGEGRARSLGCVAEDRHSAVAVHMTTREQAIDFLRKVHTSDTGPTIYQDVIDHVLVALDEARNERSLVVSWLRRQCPEGSGAWDYAAGIERGDHVCQDSLDAVRAAYREAVPDDFDRSGFPGANCGSPGRDVICACGHRAWLHAGDKDECLSLGTGVACPCRAFQ
jgi:hypothetical protein